MFKKLPSKIMVMSNPDKTKWKERWYKGRNLLNLVAPFRMLCMGPPGVGKSLVVKNVIAQVADSGNPFMRIVVVHCDPEYTQEYDDVGCDLMKEIPSPEEWPGDVKTLCVLDDLVYKPIRKDQKYALDRLFGFVSSHKGVSVILCAQDPFSIPVICRRCASVWVLWKLEDEMSLKCLAGRGTGLTIKELKDIFKNIMTNKHDSLWIDKTEGTKHPLRLNGFDDIKLKK